jgi:hypothetical protein
MASRARRGLGERG